MGPAGMSRGCPSLAPGGVNTHRLQLEGKKKKRKKERKKQLESMITFTVTALPMQNKVDKSIGQIREKT